MKKIKLFLIMLLSVVAYGMSAQDTDSVYVAVFDWDENDPIYNTPQQYTPQRTTSPDSVQRLFDENGELTRIKVSPEDVKNKIISPNPRYDDIVWQKTVLKVVDMRELQNRPLYYPCEDLTPETNKNLYSIIFSNVLDGRLPAYKSNVVLDQTYCPPFTDENRLDVEEFLNATNLRYMGGEDTWSRVNYLNPGVVKCYLKIAYYFDKSTSTFHQKILAVGPLYDENYGKRDDIRTAVFFWVPYERLRPFLQEEFVRMNNRTNVAKVSFDEFLMRGYYNSYIIKDYDVTGQDIDKGLTDPRMIRQEQQRVEDYILSVEQDLWEY